MKTPLVSVIVTAYNTAGYIEQCLTALTKQTLKQIEIICIDDASTDGTDEIIKRFVKQNPQIRAVYQKQNQGVSAARNHGIKLAKAEYIMFCDGDDYFEPEACELMHATATREQVDLVVSEINVIYHAHREMKPSDDFYYALDRSGKCLLSDDVIYSTDLAPTNKLFKKSLLQQYHLAFPEGLRFEDAYFCVAYMCACKTAFYLNRRLYNYIRHNNSLMSATWSNKNQTDIAIDHLRIAIKLYTFLEQNDLLAIYAPLFWRYFADFTRFALQNSKSKARVREVRAEARAFVAQHEESLHTAPRDIRGQVISLTTKQRLFNIVRIKRALIRLMPTYRLATENIQRLSTLKAHNQELLEKVHQLFAEEAEETIAKRKKGN